MTHFEEQVCVVTGAGSGIGRSLALALGERGALLALSDVDADAVAATAEAVTARGGAATPYCLDVADRSAVLTHADEVAADLGPAFAIINNAGVGLQAGVAEVRWEDFDWLMGINFWGVVHGTKAFLPQIESTSGHVVNVTSALSLVGVSRSSAYCSSKFGARGFTESLRTELRGRGSPARVTCVLPGAIATNIPHTARMMDESQRAKRVADFAKVARTSADKAAAVILRGVERGRGRILVGPDAVALHWASRFGGTDAIATLLRGRGLA